MKSFYLLAFVLSSYAIVEWGFSPETAAAEAPSSTQAAPANGCVPLKQCAKSTEARNLWDFAVAPQQDHEWEPNEEGKDVYFHCNPLTINGKMWDIESIPASQKGLLSLVECQPDQSTEAAIPFHIYLRRAGEIVESGLSSSTQEHTQIDLTEILKDAKEGDQLIINPVRKRDFRAKRILPIMDKC